MILRRQDSNAVFINVTEIHGSFDPINEFSSGAYPSVKQIKVLQQDARYTIAEITIDQKKLVIAQRNNDKDSKQSNQAAGFSWAGPVLVMYDNKKIN